MLHRTRAKSLETAYAAFLTVAATLVVTRVAWISDDALITLRTALNLTSGWGPGFNASENVQAYTHPLWFLVITAAGATTGQWLLSILTISIGASVLTVVLLLRIASTVGRSTLVVGLLLLSNAFVEFSTSGLENPLVFLAIALLFSLSIGIRTPGNEKITRYAVLAGLTTSAALLLRLDLALLIGPVVLALLWKTKHSGKAVVAFGASLISPLALWGVWTYTTYASLVPNTLAAKTNADIPRIELLYGGFRYLWISFTTDPVSLFIIVGAVLLGVFIGGWQQRAWGVGIVLYLGYVMWIGGDFMVGRFISVPVVVSLFIIASVGLKSASNSFHFDPVYAIAAAAVILIFTVITFQTWGMQFTSLANPQLPRWEKDLRGGIADERGEYVQRGWSLQDLFVLTGNVRQGDDARQLARIIGNWPQANSEMPAPADVETVCGGLGVTGIKAGPTIHVIDQCALSDRFLSAITFKPTGPMGWRPGHLPRTIPEGYEDAIRLNDPSRLVSVKDQARLTQLWSDIR